MTRDPLEPQPMSPEDVAKLVARVRAKQTPASLAAAQATRKRWAKYRAQRGER